jgi:hypothetical protein
MPAVVTKQKLPRGREMLAAVKAIPIDVLRSAVVHASNGMDFEEAFWLAASDYGLYGEIAVAQDRGALIKFPRIVEDY